MWLNQAQGIIIICGPIIDVTWYSYKKMTLKRAKKQTPVYIYYVLTLSKSNGHLFKTVWV